MKKLLLLLCIFAPLTLRAQDDFDDAFLLEGYSYTPILNGTMYGVKNEKTGEWGVVKEKLSVFIESAEDVKEILVVPIAYDDISLIKMMDHDKWLDVNYNISFRAELDGKNTLYDMEGHRLTDPLEGKFGWYSIARGSLFSFVSVARPDGQGYDLSIILNYPDQNITVTGPFEIAVYMETTINGMPYFYIKAKRYGTSELVDYDVFGNRLSENNMQHLDTYYGKMVREMMTHFKSLPKEKQILDENMVESYKAATLGDLSAIYAHAKTSYDMKMYDQVLKWGTPGLTYKSGYALYYEGMCFRYGYGVPMAIWHAKYLFEKAVEFGNKEAKEELANIEKISQPIKLQKGLKPNVDRWTMPLDELEDLLYAGDPEAVMLYCYRTMLVTDNLYKYYIDNPGEIKNNHIINDALAVDLLPRLLALPNDATCQIILAMIYAGDEAVGWERNYNYSFRDPEKARFWLEKYKSNPAREKAPLWCDEKDLELQYYNIPRMK